MTACLANAIYLSGLACFNVIYLWYAISFGFCLERSVSPQRVFQLESFWLNLINTYKCLQQNRTFSFISYFAVHTQINQLHFVWFCFQCFYVQFFGPSTKTNWIISISFFFAAQFITIRVLLSLHITVIVANTISAKHRSNHFRWHHTMLAI